MTKIPTSAKKPPKTKNTTAKAAKGYKTSNPLNNDDNLKKYIWVPPPTPAVSNVKSVSPRYVPTNN